ncbi:Propanoyl-CoA C-acyltransferase [Sulfolobus islandicus Y.G.57.14]|jgi:acetyl-CoA C-acetyltransferase|uniref:Propanoyl-CoA C-acyltransferase n=8 Tax=Saccharolobus TaxID=2100760 RepID=C3MN13_SACI2|nr:MULTISPECIES: thiolase domain-containing protein [Sulfolobaceae]ACP34853.1 Propanoyl-CoA C-acyltransferase [Sulfolobus islandicus L.S.2.15]ACP45102.1 Propanoyl-CoA C-acyltransferase [Sulfolobus islandicus Y.G.57.14]ACP49069.1 Propanoyl-CoA C-acyltransferase [Sulfolobus islandicus Y.N.15.51]ADB86718.1 Thiolase [Sulfolobus islandicus L.D.8.5]QPG49293.1 thiolase domain-containing protein [Saccharolobus solfataricus]
MVDVAIVGTGHSKFGNRTDVNLQELAWEAVKQALEESNLDQKDIDMFVVGNAGGWSSEPLSAIVIGEYCNLAPKGTMRVEAACATGSAALRIAYQAIKSGDAKMAMVIGVEQMHQSPNPVAVEMMGRAGNYFWEFENFGLTFPGYYGLYATRRMAKFGMKEEDLGQIAIKNHYYGSFNPYAMFQKQIKMDEYMKSRVVAYPLKVYDACPITDGAAAIILASEEVAKKITDSPVWIVSQGFKSGTANLSKRDDFISIDAARLAAEEAYKKAKIDFENSWKYFDVADVHDCFTIAEIMAYEDLGFAKRGEGHLLAREEQTYIGGKIPINVDGGLKAKGHPIGATGVSMAVSITRQLLYRAHKGTQVEVRNGMGITHNVGGTGHYAYVTIFSTKKPSV